MAVVAGSPKKKGSRRMKESKFKVGQKVRYDFCGVKEGVIARAYGNLVDVEVYCGFFHTISQNDIIEEVA